MFKTKSIPLKDYLIRRMSVKTNRSAEIIDAIITHQYQHLNDVMRTDPDVYSAEISGFGKFLFNKKKAIKKMEKNLSKVQTFTNLINDPLSSEAKKTSCTLKLANTKAWIASSEIKMQNLLCQKETNSQNTSN